MAWKCRLGYAGEELRRVINDGGEDIESCRKTLVELGFCYIAIENKVSEEEWEEISEEYDNVKEYIKTLSIPDDMERATGLLYMGYDGKCPELDCVNEALRIFYDICDDYGIWVG